MMNGIEGSSYDHVELSPSTEVVRPRVGMMFGSVEEGHQFFNCYAGKTGFNVRKGSTLYDSKTKELISKTFLCSKEGFSNLKDKTTSTDLQRRTRVVREGCKAMIRLKKCEGGWILVKFIEEHNHLLVTPRKRHLLSSQRQVTPIKKCFLIQYKAANTSTNQLVNVLESQYGFDNMGCMKNSRVTSDSIAKRILTSMSKCLLVAMESDEAGLLLVEALDNIYEKMIACMLKPSGELSNDEKEQSLEKSINNVIRPLDMCKTKGNEERIKGGKEIAMKKSKGNRLCHGCGKRGVDHDRRNCPQLKLRIPCMTQSIGVDSEASVANLDNEGQQFEDTSRY